MATRKQFLTEPYGGYHAEPTPPETADLTHVEKGSRAGELLRRYWQPVCLSEEVEKLPKRERILVKILSYSGPPMTKSPFWIFIARTVGHLWNSGCARKPVFAAVITAG